MTKVILSSETIKAIHLYIENYNLEEDFSTSAIVNDVQFRQGDIDIDVDFFFWGHIEEYEEEHDEIPPPNIEYCSELITDGGEITDIRAYNKDGNILEISNLNEL